MIVSVFKSDPEGIRTLDLRLRRALLYPAELPDQTKSTINNSQNDRSIQPELLKLSCKSSSFFGKIQQYRLKKGKDTDYLGKKC
jgi:hypothetical protein